MCKPVISLTPAQQVYPRNNSVGQSTRLQVRWDGGASGDGELPHAGITPSKDPPTAGFFPACRMCTIFSDPEDDYGLIS